MSLTVYPNGVSSFGFPLIGSGPVLSTGQVLFVDSNAGINSPDRGKSPDTPFAGIDYAIGRCGAANGDVIFVMEGHAEACTAAGTITADVEGVTIIGLGKGGARPIITISTATTASFLVSADSINVENIIFKVTVDLAVNPINVTGDDFVMRNCEVWDNGVTTQCTDIIMLNTANRAIIDGLKVLNAGTAGANSVIALNASHDVLLKNLHVIADAAVALIDFRTAASLRVRIRDSFLQTLNAADLCVKDTITGSSGIIGPNLELELADDAANITTSITGATFRVQPAGVNVGNAANQKAMSITWTEVANS